MVDENGETKLVFTHASEYVAVISDAKPAGTTLTSGSPKTGDVSNVLLYIVLMCSALVMSFGIVTLRVPPVTICVDTKESPL